MKELEKLDLAEIRIDGQEECEYSARIALRDGTELPGRIIAGEYRIVNYGFVWAADMPEMVHLGEKVRPDGFRMYDVRVIAAFVKALGLSGDWDPDGKPLPDLKTIQIPQLQEAREILRLARIPVHAL